MLSEKLMSKNNNGKKYNPEAILTAVICTVVFGLIFYNILKYNTINYYRDVNHLKPVERKGVFGGTYYEDAPVTISQLGSLYKKRVLLPTLIFVGLYPLIGRVIFLAVEHLVELCDEIFNIADEFKFGDWSPNTSLYIGAFWPITGFVLIPLLIIADLYGFAYRLLW